MFKKRYLFLVILICLFTISTVSAEDNSTSNSISVSNDVNSLETNIVENNMNSIVNDTDTLKVSNDELLTTGNNWYVNGSKNSSGDGKSEATAFNTLNNALTNNQLQDGDTIRIASGEYKGINNTGLDIDKNLNFIKYGDDAAIFDAEGLSGIWTVTATSINMTGLTFKNGKADNGGAISFSNYTMNCNIVNCSFDSNFASGDGGAIYSCLFDSSKSLIIITDSYFKNNNALHCGGAIYADNIYLYSSCFDKNAASESDIAQCCGGAIYVLNNIDILDSKFLYNNAFVDGGAIYSENTVNVNNSFFKYNVAYGTKQYKCHGGAISAKQEVKVFNSTFLYNKVKEYGGAIYTNNVYIYSSYFADNGVFSTSTYGGAIYCENNADIVNSTFYRNHVSYDGGAIYSENNVNVKNSTFKNNAAAGALIFQCRGGAIMAKNEIKVDNSSFLDNRAYDYGGAIYADTITWVDSPSYFIGNYVEDNCGGAIYTNKFNTDVKYGVFINNTVEAKDDGGAIYINKKNLITFSQCVFVNNHCGDEGGAIYLDSSKSHLTLVNNIFISNSAKEGQTVYNCGIFDSINNNWWGGINPSSSNDQLIEWKAWPVPNVHHIDSAPLELLLKLSENTCKVNTIVCATGGFYNTDGSLCSGEMITDYISFMPISDIEFSNRTDDKVYVTTLISPQKEGQYNITANLFGQLASDVLTAVNDSQYMLENAFNSTDVVNTLSNNEELFGLPNEPYGGFIDSLNNSPNTLIDSDNVLVNNEHNVAMDSNVEANNGNANLFNVISNVENYTNSTNKTPNDNTVAKTIGDQPNGSSFNYFWILLLIVIFAGVGVLIKQYKN